MTTVAYCAVSPEGRTDRHGDGGSAASTGRRLCAGPRSRRVCGGATIRRGGFAATIAANGFPP
jgi:hypothetical protein